ncbi:MAG: hypothetical protein SGJ02_09160 [bacterium]|nr:hypothetical protein [bacterium]
MNHEISDKVGVPDLAFLAEEIAKRRLSVPAIFILEMYKPLFGIFREATIISYPLLVPIVGAKLYKVSLTLLSSQDKIEELIKLIEAREEFVHGN